MHRPQGLLLGALIVESLAPRPLNAATPENTALTQPSRSNDLESDVAAMKADNAAVREQLRKMEEQQKALLELVDRLQRRLDGINGVTATAAGTVPGTTQGAEAPAPPPLNAQIQTEPKKEDRYRDGMVIWETPDDDKVPFLLKFNLNTQFRYLNTLSSDDTFTDHLGNVRDVHKRNDLTVNRAMFILNGYVFDKRLQYSYTVWTAAGAASIVVAGNIGWRFNQALTITGGYNGAPGVRSLVNTFPFFTGVDRSMADNFFRPGFTQGVWASGEPLKGLNYMCVRRQRSQYAEYLGQQDRHASAAFRQCLVGTAGGLRGTRQITQHVR